MEKFSSIQSAHVISRHPQMESNGVSALGKSVVSAFREMIRLSKEMFTTRKKLHDTEAEEARLYEAKEIIDSNLTAIKTEDRLLRKAYYILPVIDGLLALLGVHLVLSHKLSQAFGETAAIVGYIVALPFGIGLSLFSRFTMASVTGKFSKVLIATGSAILLPFIYVASELVFSGGTTWGYTICCSLASCVVQAIVIFGYSKQLAAVDKFQAFKSMATTQKEMKKSQRYLKRKAKKLNADIETIKRDFEKALKEFTTQFMNMTAARTAFIDKNAVEPQCHVGELILWLGNLLCYNQRDAFPKEYQSEVQPAASSSGVHLMYCNKDLYYLYHMYDDELGMGVSLDECFASIQKSRTQDASSPVELEDVEAEKVA